VLANPLTRLRLGFLALGVLLLVPLALLLREAESRLEAQRQLRHQIVAERVFDEMERELGLLLASERERPSAAYDAPPRAQSAWAPFVVGYFTRDRTGNHVLGAEQLPGARAARVASAVDALWASGMRPSVGESRAAADEQDVVDVGGAKSKQEAVLQKLNRATKQRSTKAEPKSAPTELGL
jgi:hypothetical protein